MSQQLHRQLAEADGTRSPSISREFSKGFHEGALIATGQQYVKASPFAEPGLPRNAIVHALGEPMARRFLKVLANHQIHDAEALEALSDSENLDLRQAAGLNLGQMLRVKRELAALQTDVPIMPTPATQSHPPADTTLASSLLAAAESQAAAPAPTSREISTWKPKSVDDALEHLVGAMQEEINTLREEVLQQKLRTQRQELLIADALRSPLSADGSGGMAKKVRCHTRQPLNGCWSSLIKSRRHSYQLASKRTHPLLHRLHLSGCTLTLRRASHRGRPLPPRWRRSYARRSVRSRRRCSSCSSCARPCPPCCSICAARSSSCAPPSRSRRSSSLRISFRCEALAPQLS